ncbi:hypothetical protein RN001_012993 [Aquatica leii]|uniref:Cytochrome c oxidase polypeptide VIa n=1 Tax=Aquatica leii TaxID=1421715 RepID=A0AAN7QCT0_9COLE|nr:hypothetical protein RN001_012993 [Aquatica leii]
MSAILNYAARRYISSTLALGAKVEGPSAVSGGHGGGYKVWRNLTFFVAAPAITLCAINCVLQHQKEHDHERPPFVKYEYRCMRTKRFPWGDGNHSLFHNPHTNPLPTGYED